MSLPSTQEMIAAECDAIKKLLLEKNAKYGNSALEPSRVFSKADAIEQIKVRIDDKLSRIRTSGTSGADEDTEQDLIGYLVLLRVARKSTQEQPSSSPQPLVESRSATAAGTFAYCGND